MIEQIDVRGATDGSLEVTLRGKPDAVIKTLVSGLPLEALEQFHAALQTEIQKRDRKKKAR
jgi:hypothetical protein